MISNLVAIFRRRRDNNGYGGSIAEDEILTEDSLAIDTESGLPLLTEQ